MKNKQEYLMNVFNHFLGYGSINSRLIYFGIEEHGNKNKDVTMEESRLETYVSKYESINSINFFSIESNDFERFYLDYPEQKELDENNSKKSKLYKYCQKIDKNLQNNNSLICNLYPLWKNTTSEPSYDSFTQSKFGVINFQNWYEKYYYSLRKVVLLRYFEYLISTKEDCKVFTFGESVTFINLFIEILKNSIINIDKPKYFSSKGRNNKYWVIKFKNLNIYILYHPSYKWINENQLKELLNNL